MQPQLQRNNLEFFSIVQEFFSGSKTLLCTVAHCFPEVLQAAAYADL